MARFGMPWYGMILNAMYSLASDVTVSGAVLYGFSLVRFSVAQLSRLPPRSSPTQHCVILSIRGSI